MYKTKVKTILSRPISGSKNKGMSKLNQKNKIHKISKKDNTMTLQTILLSPTPNSKRLSAEKSRWSRFRERKSWSQTMHELCCYCR
jgi:hypothetical protein